MDKSYSPNEKIALYETELDKLKSERQRLRRRKEKIEMKQLKIQNELLSNERDSLKEQRNAMMECLRRIRIDKTSGQSVILWKWFIEDYKKYAYLDFT